MKTNRYEILFKKPYFLIDEFIQKDVVLAESYDKVVEILNKEYSLEEEDYSVTDVREVTLYTNDKIPVRSKHSDLINIDLTKEISARRHYDN